MAMWEYRVGHVIDILRTLPEESVQCVVTSPPYWGLRKYHGEQDVIWGGDENCQHEFVDCRGGLQHENRNFRTGSQDEVAGSGPLVNVREDRYVLSGQCSKCGAWKGAYGLEPTVEMYVQHTVEILREIRRVLRKDGIVFWNIGDCYAGGNYCGISGDRVSPKQKSNRGTVDFMASKPPPIPDGLKPKDLVMVPFRVALAVQADGWYVRSDIIWAKPNPMPESCTDRPTKSHEYIFLLTKSKDYYWDQEAVREQCVSDGGSSFGKVKLRDEAIKAGQSARVIERSDRERYIATGRNLRSVWTIAIQPYSGSHFAVFPEEIPRRCILAGTSAKGRCPKCGACWERIVEHTPMPRNDKRTHSTKDHRQGKTPCPEPTGDIISSSSKTLGWKPSCQCSAGEPVPCLVLDPFAGSGTTLRVARDLGRDAIGIDICNDYKELAVKRADLNMPDIMKFGVDV